MKTAGLNEAGGGEKQMATTWDYALGQPIVAMPVSPTTAIAVMPVKQLLEVVLDPEQAEKPALVKADPRLAAYAEIRETVQRAVKGAKAKNARSFGEYLVRGHRGERPWVTPPITLYHREQLAIGQDLGNGSVVLALPYGDALPAIDGETQRIAWQKAALIDPSILEQRVAVVIHHGRPIEDARQFFYDLNTLEVKPTAAIAVGMNMLDPATKITKRVIDESDILRGHVSMQKRQLGKGDTDLLTISALRTGIVTTILGSPGLQVGSRPLPNLPEGVDLDALEQAVVDVWVEIISLLEDELAPARRPESVVSAPAVLAGIGVVAHRAMPTPPRNPDTEEWEIDDVTSMLSDVTWDRMSKDTETPSSPWDGIAGKFTPSGRFAIGGPKEVGYAVADALGDKASNGSQSIRSKS